MKIQRFYSSIDQKIDFCQALQDHLLSDTVPFRAYYVKTRPATYAWFCKRMSHIFWNSRKGDVPYSCFLVVLAVCYENVAN